MTPLGRLDEAAYDYNNPLILLDTVSSVELVPGGAVLECATRRYFRTVKERYGTFVEIGEAGEAARPEYLKITFLNESGSFRMQMGSDVRAFDRISPMLAAEPQPLTAGVSVEQQENRTTVRSNELAVEVDHYPLTITVRDHENRELWSSLPTSQFQHAPTGMADVHGASISDAWPWFFRRMLPLGYIESGDGGDRQVFLTARLGHNEHLHGFGEVYTDIDRRGDQIDIWHANATGNTWPESYKSIPFFMSSRGYGMFVHSARAVSFHLGDLSRTRYSIQNQSPVLDLFFFNGPSYDRILPRYVALTGKAGLPPLWSFGVWMSRMSYDSQEQVEEVARELRERDIPCDVIHVDTDWFDKPWINDLTFSHDRFPEPKEMIEKLKKQGFRLSLWQIPYISVESSFYEEGRQGGYFARTNSGDPWLLDGFFGKAAIVDYSNPDAVAWMQKKIGKLFDLGVSVIKTDFGEGAPTEAEYHAYSGEEMHNLYPLLYNKAFYEKTQEKTHEGIVWSRSGYAGSQRYPVHWGGDPAALWDDLANLWQGGLSLGLTGVPFWSIDIGGFGGTPSPELYIRWLETGLFVSHPRAHGPIGREPWLFGQKAEELFRAYATLRYRLLPYVWNEAVVAVETALPMHQPLLLQWQDDPTTANIDDEYLFGRSLLVAPVLDETDRRKVYLPEGAWFDLWSDRIVNGPLWEELSVPLEELPMYVRADSIIPMIDPILSTGEANFGRIHVHLYPREGSREAISLPDGRTLTVSVQRLDDGFELRVTGDDIEVVPHVHGVPGRSRRAPQMAEGETLSAVRLEGAEVSMTMKRGIYPG